MAEEPDQLASERHLRRQRWKLLSQIYGLLDVPLIVLSFVWLILLIIDLTRGLSPVLLTVHYVIWGIFVLAFLIGIALAPEKKTYLKRNWLTAVSLLLPALRVLRVVQIVRTLRFARAARTINLLRFITSINRGIRAVSSVLAHRGIGFVITLTIMVTLVSAVAMAHFESPRVMAQESLPGPGLRNYPDALWWTAMMVTTMGSEYWPKSTEGRIVGWMLSVYAFTIFGYITASIASFFIETEQRQERQRQQPSRLMASSGSSEEIIALRGELAELRQRIEILLSRRER